MFRGARFVDLILVLFVLAVLANVCYCAAYIVDIFNQFTAFRSIWLRFRWLLLALGTCFAAIATYYISGVLFLVASD